MNIQKINSQYPATTFTGYDARKLRGIVMTTNYDGIADEMKRIGEIENFKIFLFNKNKNGLDIRTDKFEQSPNHNGCWAQDRWGIVKDTLLIVENSIHADYLKKFLNKIQNPVQKRIRDNLNYENVSEYVDILYNMPITKKGGKEGVEFFTDKGSIFVEKEVHDNELKINIDLLKNLISRTHIKGGNYFITKNSNGEDELLLGKNEFIKLSDKAIKEMFQCKKIHSIPQADYHLDLFIRPLKDKKVLLADDETMLNTMIAAQQKLTDTILKTPANDREKFRDVYVNLSSYIEGFKKIIQQNPYSGIKDVEKALIDGGYEPIKVPARLFEIYKDSNNYLLKNLHNYINAVVHINDKNELVYITNKSNLDERLGLTPEMKKLTGISMEQAFLDAVKPHVDKVYFVSGNKNSIPEKLLPEYYGGIHCMGMEVI